MNLRTLFTTFAPAAFATAAEKSSVRRLLAVIVAVGLIGSPASAPAQDSPDPLAGEWSVEWFQKQQDHAKKWEPFWRGRCERLREMWRTEPDSKAKEAVWNWLSEAIVNYGGGGDGDEFDALFIEHLASRPLADLRLLPPPAKELRVTRLKNFPALSRSPEDTEDGSRWVARRIGPKRFELWRPFQGWLFDELGRVVSKAEPDREERDARGREWYGAFWPDGSWVTTENEVFDGRLYFYDKTGRRLRSVPSEKLLTKQKQRAIIGWCRSTADGKSMLVKIGSEDGIQVVRLSRDGTTRDASDLNWWSLCHPGDLEPKGFYIDLFCLSQDWLKAMKKSAGHGHRVGYPSYSIGPEKSELQQNHWVVPGGATFGFAPRTNRFWIETDVTLQLEKLNAAANEEEPGADDERWFDTEGRTLFFSAKGKLASWAEGSVRGVDGPRLWLTDAARSVTVLDCSKTPVAVHAFNFRDTAGSLCRPFRLYPDLRLGFFIKGDEVWLGKW